MNPPKNQSIDRDLCGSGYLFANQFINNLNGAFVYRLRFGKKIINRYGEMSNEK